MRRRLFNLATVVSLVLFITTVVLWVRGRSRIDVARYARPVDAGRGQTRIELHSGQGILCLSRTRREQSQGPVEELMGGGLASYPIAGGAIPFSGFHPSDPQVLGFGLSRSSDVDPPTGPWERRWTHLAISVPHWFAAVLFAGAPARWLVVRQRTRARRRENLCGDCGYDLRASPGRCPECGATAAR